MTAGRGALICPMWTSSDDVVKTTGRKSVDLFRKRDGANYWELILPPRSPRGEAFMQIVDGPEGGRPVRSPHRRRVPLDGEVFASIPAAGEADVDRAGSGPPHLAPFHEGPWAKMPAVERGRLPDKALPSGRKAWRRTGRAGIARQRQAGPAGQGRNVTATMRYYEFYGGAGDKIHWRHHSISQTGYTALTLREPHGVVGRHHSLELPAADPGPRGGARACHGQHVCWSAARRFATTIPHRELGLGAECSQYRLWREAGAALHP